MPSVPTRELSITYGTYTVSPDGGWTFSDTSDAFTLEFSFNVTGATTSEADFATACAAAVTAYRKPFQDLTITQGSQTQSFKPSANTGLETRASIVKVQDHVVNTGRSRRYTVRVTGGRPADNVTTSGLREYSYAVQYAPNNRRLVTISGVWTAVGGTAARAGYEAGIAAVCDATLSALGMTSAQVEIVGVPRAESSYNDKTLTFSRDYKEIKFGQIGAGNDSGIVEQQLRISVRRWSEKNAPAGMPTSMLGKGETSAGGGSSAGGGQALPLTEITASYECWVRFDVTTDLESKWTAIESFVLAEMRKLASGKPFAPTEITPTYHRDDNRITATVRGVVVASGLVRSEWQQVHSNNVGTFYAPVWNGNPAAKLRYDGPSDMFVTTRVSRDVVGGGGSGGSGASGGDAGFGGADFGWGGIATGAGGFPGFSFPADPAFPADQPGGWYGPGSGAGGTPTPAPGGDAGGGGNAGASALDTISTQSTQDRYQFGLDTPITITRTTTVTVQRAYTRISVAAFTGAHT